MTCPIILNESLQGFPLVTILADMKYKVSKMKCELA